MRQTLRAFTVGMALTTALTVGAGAALADAPNAAPRADNVSVSLGTGSGLTDLLAGGVLVGGLGVFGLVCVLRSASGTPCDLNGLG
ncbi:hypothetical protein [Nocardia sp. NPDC006630]|uniref:hypothetical protein n=1 Tax=Nocardia sp. NPDC006630 TaxID=3157181 RepID=UPI0033AAF62A